MAALSVSKRALSGWQMVLLLRKVTRFCPSHLPFSPLSRPCSPHCQLPSRVQMPAPHWRSAGGNNRQGSRRRKKKVDRGQRDELKGVQVWQGCLLRTARWVRLKCDEPREDGQENKGERDESDGSRQNKRTHFLLCQFLVILLCGLLVLSGAQERLSLLYKSENNNNNNSETFLFFFPSTNFTFESGTKAKLDALFRPEGTGVPGCVATGLAGTGVLGSEDKLSVSFFSSMPIGIRSGELSFPFTCSNSCTYKKKKRECCSTVIKWKSDSVTMAYFPQIRD